MPERTREKDNLQVDSDNASTPESTDVNSETAGVRKHIFAPDQQATEIEKGKWLLQALKSWEKIEKDEEIRQIIEPLILEFISKDPTPSDPEINNQIRVLCWYAEKCLIARRMMAAERNPDMPDDIRLPLLRYVEEHISENPQMLPGEIHTFTNGVVQEAKKMIKQATADEIFHIHGLRNILVGDVIRIIYKRIHNITEPTNGHSMIRSLRPDSSQSSLRPDTIPGTPAAKRRRQG